MKYLPLLALLLAAPAAAQPPKMKALPKDLKPFEFIEAKVPFYSAGKPGSSGKPLTQMQLPLEPAESLRHMVHPIDFDVHLVAAEPDIRRPICMNWDERGRLWIAESVDYPNNLQKEGKGNDRLIICEDTDGDGRMDKFKVFADKLSIPTSFTFAQGGVIVHQAPHTLFLKDTDGDDVADERKILFTGWSTGDTHAGPSNLHYGLDNWIYGTVGYAGFKGTVGGEKHDFRTGIYRFKPDGSRMEFLRNTSNNTWGLGISEEGLIFASTANGNPSVFMPIPNRFYEAVKGWSSTVLPTIATSDRFYPVTDKVRQVDYHGRFTAAAGHALYTARLYPKYYWNRTAFVCEPTGHLVATFEIERKGADFASRNAWNLLASDDEWTSPIMAEVGPDGCVWVIDWYNYIIQHNPTPAGFKTGKGNAYETPLRDKKHGRIVKLVPKGARLPANLDLNKASPADLVATLKNDNFFWRRHAQRLLVERGKTDVVPELVKLAEDPGVDEVGLNVSAMHALWTLHGLGALTKRDKDTEALFHKSFRHPAAGVRRAAVEALPRNKEGLGIFNLVANRLVEDADPRVRLAVFLTLAEMPPREGPESSLLLAFDEKNLKSRALRDGLIAAAARNDASFLESLESDNRPWAPGHREVLSIVAEHYARRGGDGNIAAILEGWHKEKGKEVELLVKTWAKSWPKGKAIENKDAAEKSLTRLFPALSPAGKADLVRLSQLWGTGGIERFGPEILKAVTASLADEKESDASRLEAARQLLLLQPGDPKSVEQILDTVTPRTPPALGSGLLEALSSSTAPDLASALLKRLPEFSPTLRATGIRILLSKAETTRPLLDALENGGVSFGDLALDQKQALLTHPDKGIAARAKKLLASGGGLPSADRQKVIEQFLPLLAKKADPAAGKLMFKKHCAVCHTHSGEGNKVGPDLTGMAVHPKHELLIHILDPSRSVEGNYRLYQVATADGRFLNGMLASESKTAIELIDAQAKKSILQREEIETLKATPQSLMPDGFEKQMSEAELLDLLEFLTQRGKYLPLPLERVANVVSTRGMFFTKESPVERLILSDWSPRTVKGVPFQLIDPKGDRVPNVLMLHGPQGATAPTMPRSVKLPCNSPAKAIHFLSGISGWGYPASKKGSVSLIVRLHYEDGKTEDHPLVNGEHFADYIRRVDVPGSEFAFSMGGKQMRYLAVTPKRAEVIREIELVKPAGDESAPVVLAVTVEGRK